MKIVEVINVDFALAQFLLPLMREARAQGHDVVGMCADGPLLDRVRAEGFRVAPLPLQRSLNPLALWRGFWALRRALAAEKPDLVHAHMPISGVLGRLAAKSLGVPRIATTCHGFLFNQPGPLPRRVLGWVAEFIAARCTDVFLTVSREEAIDARRCLLVRNPAAIGNGANPARFHPDPAGRARLRAELGTPEDAVVILIASRLVRHKGYPELLAAMEMVPQGELWVVGARLPSDHGEDMEPHFARSTLGPRLRRLGWRNDMPDLLAAADIFVLPSHFEGLPMSMIEAMHSGLPLIATDIRGPRELVEPGVNGLLVPRGAVQPLAEAINRLVQDPVLRARMAAASRQIALTRFDEGTIARQTLDLLTRTR
jgi:glycosyltransferase involved in cell wall biosynthesis